LIAAASQVRDENLRARMLAFSGELRKSAIGPQDLLIRRSDDIARRLIKMYGDNPDLIEKIRAAAEEQADSDANTPGPLKPGLRGSDKQHHFFPPGLTADYPKGLGEEGWMGVEMALAKHLGVLNMEDRQFTKNPDLAKHMGIPDLPASYADRKRGRESWKS
jgi:hypothetical protein